jgi:nucleotide-binding universal stress UspA family protein
MRDRPLVVGVDGSTESARALAEAIDIVSTHPGQGGLDLVVAFVRQSSWAATTVYAGAGFNDALDEIEANVRKIAGDALWGTSLSWRFEVRSGEPARELVRVAREFDAQTIVVGGHRHGAIGSAVTQSVNSELVHIYPGSLLIIRPARITGDEPAADAHRDVTALN